MKNYYEILEVNINASPEIIEKAYHILAKKYHPDKKANEKDKINCEEQLKNLNEAYYVLSDVFLREQYDKELKEQNNKKEMRKETKNNTENKVFSKIKNSIKKDNKEENIEETNEGEYKTGTIDALIALFKEVIKNRPDTSKIKNATKKDIIILIISILIVAILCVALWFIPFTNGFIRNLLFMR